ncbi:MAG TPA: AAA family ATPase [Rhizomicrobium sp.]|jgi:predicted ATPase
MRFRVLDNNVATPTEGRDTAYLWTDNWNDWFKYATLYVLTYFDSEGARHELGGVKIGEFNMEKGQGRPNLPAGFFPRLPKRCFSLGQDVSYYSAIAALGPESAAELLAALRDMVADHALFERARDEDVTGMSLLRSVSVRSVTGQFRRVLQGGAPLTEYSFKYDGPLPLDNSGQRLTFDFHVTPESMPPTNIHVLIGRNGVGKTYILNRMTRALVLSDPDSNADGEFSSEDVFLVETREGPFANIVSVSFSAFDDFALLPERRNALKGVRYSSVGLRKRVKDKNDQTVTITRDPDDLASEFASSAKLCALGDKSERWKRALTTLEADPLFEEAHVADLAEIEERAFGKEAHQLWRKLSSGHKIVLLTITKLVEKVEERSLVLMDEPEAHLHPPLLSAFVRALSDLLIHRNGVAIIATHSPVVLQEVPMSCVWKIVRHGVAVRADRPEIETFAENVGVLTREVFGLEVTRSGFHKMLSDAAADERSIPRVLGKFDNEVGSDGRALVSGLIANRLAGEG